MDGRDGMVVVVVGFFLLRLQCSMVWYTVGEVRERGSLISYRSWVSVRVHDDTVVYASAAGADI